MPRLTIDDRPVEVPDGATILDAAEEIGLEIPTLCFLKGYEPSTSCSVCVVRNRQTGQFVPACATQVVEGMQIENNVPQVAAMRRTALELLMSDHVGDCLAPCYFACPAHMDIPLMLRQIGDRDVRDAIATIKNDIALPAVLGRICPKPCEKGCRRTAADDPVAVCELKRFVADQDLALADPYLPPCAAETGKQIAVVGAGPTGLAATYYLRRRGHAVTLFDKASMPGGRLRSESFDSPLPASVLDSEIDQVLRLGVTTRWETSITQAEQLDQLQQQFDAVLLACGNGAAVLAEQLGLAASRRGIAFDRQNYSTERTGLFAAGNAVRGQALVVRSTADGKEVAQTIDQYVTGQDVRGPARPFSSRIAKISDEEMEQFLAGAGSDERQTPDQESSFEGEAASEQSNRCLECGCSAHGNCRLERYSILYQADASRYSGKRREYEVIGRESDVLFEPGKCIKCELCIKIADAASEPLGLAFVGRGFDVQLQVPFGGGMDEALTQVAQECIDACPTAALRFTPVHHRTRHSTR